MRIDEKTNEISEIQSVMKGLDCRRCIVNADAMNAQKETARIIVQEIHGELLPCTQRQPEADL